MGNSYTFTKMKLIVALTTSVLCAIKIKAQDEIYEYVYEDETTISPTTNEPTTVEPTNESSVSDSDSKPKPSLARAALIATNKRDITECHFDIFGRRICQKKTITTGHCPLNEEFRLGSLPEPTCDMRYPFVNQKRMECFCK